MSIGIDAPGRVERTVTLERGLTISGTLLGIGGTLTQGNGGFLAAYDNAQSPWIMADVDDRSGTFVLRGLEDRLYALVHDGDEWSRALIENVRAGTSDLTIQLKLERDLRDIGEHQAELHGEVRDANTGEVLLLPAFTIESIRLADVDGEQWQRDVLPSLIFPRPVQTAMFGEYIPPKAFHLEGLEPGRYAISARLEGYGPAFAGPFELVRNELRTGIVINLEAPAVLRGVLTDPSGRPLANGFARVTGLGEASIARDRAADLALRATRGQGVIDVWDQVPTDEEGRFEFPALPGWSNLRLAVHHPDFEMAYSKPLELHAGSTTDLGAVQIGARQPR